MVQYPGVLITFEGIDGAGKTTLIQAVADTISSIYTNAPVIVTKQPGGTTLGGKVRSLIADSTDISGETEFLLFAADRAEHVCRIVKPALAEGKIVLVDRMADSSLAYQGYGRGVDKAMIKAVNDWVLAGLVPDMTVYLSIPVEVSKERVRARGQGVSHFEQDALFLERVKAGFDALSHRSHVHLYDGTRNFQELADEIAEEVSQLWLCNQQ